MLCMEPHRLSVLALFLFSIAVFYFIVVVLPSSDESMETAVVCDTGCRAVDSLRLITVVSILSFDQISFLGELVVYDTNGNRCVLYVTATEAYYLAVLPSQYCVKTV